MWHLPLVWPVTHQSDLLPAEQLAWLECSSRLFASISLGFLLPAFTACTRYPTEVCWQEGQDLGHLDPTLCHLSLH